MAPDTQDGVTAILNHGWMLRHYASGRTAFYRARRAQAIERLGLAVREAFTRSNDFGPLLAAVADALRPRNDPPF